MIMMKNFLETVCFKRMLFSSVPAGAVLSPLFSFLPVFPWGELADSVGINQGPTTGTLGTHHMLGRVSGSLELLLVITENIKRIKSYFPLYSGSNCSYISMQKLRYCLRKLSLFSWNLLTEIKPPGLEFWLLNSLRGLKTPGLVILFGLNLKCEWKSFCKKNKFTFLYETKWKLQITPAFTFQKISIPLPAYLPRLEFTMEPLFNLEELLLCPALTRNGCWKECSPWGINEFLCFSDAKKETLLILSSIIHRYLTFTFLKSEKLRGAALFSFHSWLPC